jgi:flotillin
MRLSGEGERSRREALAEAERFEGEREGSGEQQRREAIATAVEAEGRAEAAAILAKGEAEAEAMRQKADAFRQYGDAAVLDLVIAVLPDVVRAAAEPLSAIDRMTVISTDGASQLAKSVASNVEQGMQIGSDLTGLDLRGLFTRLASDGGASTSSPTSFVPVASAESTDSGDIEDAGV